MRYNHAIATMIVLALLGFELTVFTTLAFFPYIVDPGLAALHIRIQSLLDPLSTIILLGLLYCWLLRLAESKARRSSPWYDRFAYFLGRPFGKTIVSIREISLSNAVRSVRVLSRPRLVLALSMICSVILGLVPYRPDLNMSQSLVGVDSPLYVGWISAMLARHWPQAIQYSLTQGLNGSRPLLLVPLYFVASIGILPSTIVEYLPAVISPLLSISTYIFVRYGQGSARLAGLVAILTPMSFYTTVGLWGGYYANWIALVFAYLFMTVLVRFSNGRSSRDLAMMNILSLVLFLTHPWTWILVLTVSLVFGVTIWRETRNLVHLESIFGIILTGVVLDIVKSAVFETRAVAADIATKFPGSLESLIGFWNDLVQALLYNNGGIMANWFILGLAMLATFALRFNDRFERLLLLWTAISSLPFLVFDGYNQSRIIYDLPLPVLNGLAVVFFLPKITNKPWQGILTVIILLAIANSALNAVLSLQ